MVSDEKKTDTMQQQYAQALAQKRKEQMEASVKRSIPVVNAEEEGRFTEFCEALKRTRLNRDVQCVLWTKDQLHELSIMALS